MALRKRSRQRSKKAAAAWLAAFKRKHGCSPVTYWRRKNPETAARHRERESARWFANPETRLRAALQGMFHRHQIKAAAYNAYGGFMCVCCGETEEAFLCLDHVDGKGSEHRRQLGKEALGQAWYLWLKRNNYPKGLLQVLCMNCNSAKSRLGKCPHETEDWA